jgi:hypothetical protein
MTSPNHHFPFVIRHSRVSGFVTIYVLIFSSVAILVLSGLVLWADTNMRLVFRDYDRALAFMLSEAGIEYYRWHLSVAPLDYQDGTAQAGPYEHDVLDKDGNTIGSFSLDITAPLMGTTVLGLDSTGTVASNSDIRKKIETQVAITSYTKFAAVVGGFLWYPTGSEIFGPVHSNSGVRVDGFAHNLVTSAVETFNDPTHGGGSAEFGVHTHKAPTDPAPGNPVPDRPDVFGAGRQFPVAPNDFYGLTNDLAAMKASAQAEGFYRGSVTGNDVGYHVVLKTNDTFDLYKVTAVEKPPNNCTTVIGEKDWGTWTIKTQTLLGNYTLPANGLMFFEDHVWVDGQINTARITIGAALFPEQSNKVKNIIVNNDLLYTNYDGRDTIGLIAQNNVNVGMVSDDDLRIDGALIAQTGQVGRYYYKAPTSQNNRGCEPYHTRSKLTLYGLLAAQSTYGFKYDDGTGYQSITIIYDANMLFAPPPSFPLVSNYYTIIYWNEAE